MGEPPRAIMLACAAAAWLAVTGCGRQEERPLLCYVGTTMRPAMEELAELFERKTGQRVAIDHADAGTLLTKIETDRRGDLYVSHDPFAAALTRKGMGVEVWTVAALSPAIAVPKGNAKDIRCLGDLARPGLRIGLTDARHSTLGHICPGLFAKAGVQQAIEGNVAMRRRTGGEVADAVAEGELDAAIVWDAVVFARRNELDGITIEPAFRPRPEVDAVTTPTFGPIDLSTIGVRIATLRCSKRLGAAAAFAGFVASERGRAIFAAHGFSPASAPAREVRPAPAKPPRVGSDEPPLYLYCADGIRPAIAECTDAFAVQTGIRVLADYAGSGVLLSRVQRSKRGDLYLAGSPEYVERAKGLDLIRSRHDICYLVPVILVGTGNPKGITTLADLTRPGVRLGIGDPEACAIGKVSQAIFRKNGLPLSKLQENLASLSLTVDHLATQIQGGDLDGAIVWSAVAARFAEHGEAIAIPREQNAISTAAIAVLRSCGRPQVAGRFVEYLTGDAGRAILARHHHTTDLPAR